MTAFIAFVRGVNVGGNKMLSSAALKAACESLGFSDVKTYLNSGNAVFRAAQASSRRPGGSSRKPPLHESIEHAIRESANIEARVILRTSDELRAAIDANPFPDEAERDPSHLLINFMSDALDTKAAALLKAYSGSEKLKVIGRELFVHYQDMARSKLTPLLTEKKLGVAITGRNWNTVNALLRLAVDLA